MIYLKKNEWEKQRHMWTHNIETVVEMEAKCHVVNLEKKQIAHC